MTKLSDTQLVILSAACARDDAHVPSEQVVRLKGAAQQKVINSLFNAGLIETTKAEGLQDFRMPNGDGLRATPAAFEALGMDLPADYAPAAQPPAKGKRKAKPQPIPEGPPETYREPDGTERRKVAADLTVPTRKRPAKIGGPGDLTRQMNDLLDAPPKAKGKPRGLNALDDDGNLLTTGKPPQPKAKVSKRRQPQVNAEAAVAKVRASKTAPAGNGGAFKIVPGSTTETMAKLLRRKQGATIPEVMLATDWLAHTARARISNMRKAGLKIETSKAPGEDRVYRLLD